MDQLTTHALSSLVSGALGAIVGWYLKERSEREKPSAVVSGIELSGAMLTKVDYISVPDPIADKLKRFRYHADSSTSKGLSSLPVGDLQAQAYFLEEFLPRCESAIRLIDQSLTLAETLDTGRMAEQVPTLLSNKVVLHNVIHLARAGALAIFRKYPQGQELPEVQPLLSWTRDDASGPGQGTRGHYSIALRHARVTFPFNWGDEEHWMKLLSFSFATCEPEMLKSVLKDLREDLRDEQILGTELAAWMRANLDKSSTFCVSVNVTNVGGRPFLVDQYATLVVPRTQSEPFTVNCLSEDFNDGSESDKSSNRTIQLFKAIAELLDAPIPVKSRVAIDKTLVAPRASRQITFRSVCPLEKIKEYSQLLNSYRSGDVRAVLRVAVHTSEGERLDIASAPFEFRSSVLHGRENET